MACDNRRPVAFRIDDIDSRILALAEEDGRRSNRDIARILKLSEKQVGARLRRLLDGDVMRIVAAVDVFAAGFEFMLTMGVQVRGRPADEVAEQLAAFPEVLTVVLMSGPWDIEIVVVAANHAALGAFVKERLSRVAGIGALAPSLRFDVLKYRIGLGPLLPRRHPPLEFPRNSALDGLDRDILRELWRDARATNQAIAARLGTSEPTVRARVARLREKGVLRITAVNNLEVGERVVFAFVGLEVERARASAVARQLTAIPEVRFAATVLGRWDILAIVVVESAAALAMLLNGRIARIRGVERAETRQALRFVKHDHRWTLIAPA